MEVTRKETYINAIYVEFEPPDPKELRGRLQGYIFHCGESTSGTMTPKAKAAQPDLRVRFHGLRQGGEVVGLNLPFGE